MNKPPGPFSTETEARELPAVRQVYAAFRADPGAGKMTPHNHRLLCDALNAAGVELGAYDHRIALWLAGFEPQTVAVVAGWITRASRAAASEAGAGGYKLLLIPADPMVVGDVSPDRRLRMTREMYEQIEVIES